MPRNNNGLKLLQYIRDEAHRFAQHYHHILRRKAQLEEDVKQGRRPPAKKTGAAAKPKTPRERKAAYDDSLKQPMVNENPHTTIASLPILHPPSPQDEELTPDEMFDPEDAAVSGDVLHADPDIHTVDPSPLEEEGRPEHIED